MTASSSNRLKIGLNSRGDRDRQNSMLYLDKYLATIPGTFFHYTPPRTKYPHELHPPRCRVTTYVATKSKKSPRRPTLFQDWGSWASLTSATPACVGGIVAKRLACFPEKVSRIAEMEVRSGEFGVRSAADARRTMRGACIRPSGCPALQSWHRGDRCLCPFRPLAALPC